MDNIVTWDEETPIGVRFDDPYFSKRDGQAETRHVFIEGNDLPLRLANAKNFHVGELGFGTALNFLETLKAWRTHASSEAHLTFTSFELFPLTKEEIERALAPWSDLLEPGKAFLDQLPKEPGWHEIKHENICLKLGIGDANHLIHDIEEPVDAWFLDGFSPAKNPELWNQDLMNMAAGKTRPNGTFSTYTAAGWVRRMLEQAGFEVERCKGFGTKRHMTCGTLIPPAEVPST